MIILPTKKKWFDMVFAEEKGEEYRKITPYYTSRFINMMFGCKIKPSDDDIRRIQDNLRKKETSKHYYVMFRNGYSKKSPSFIAEIALSIRTGREEWGAEPGVEYYILRIVEVQK